jgi:hypothetical protein
VELRIKQNKPNTNEDLPPIPEKLTEGRKDDGFDFIRKKKRLMTHAERLIKEGGDVNDNKRA